MTSEKRTAVPGRIVPGLRGTSGPGVETLRACLRWVECCELDLVCRGAFPELWEPVVCCGVIRVSEIEDNGLLGGWFGPCADRRRSIFSWPVFREKDDRGGTRGTLGGADTDRLGDGTRRFLVLRVRMLTGGGVLLFLR